MRPLVVNMFGQQAQRMRWWLFFIFSGLFAAAYVLTISSLFFGLGSPNEVILNRLATAFIIETGAAVITLFYALFGLRKSGAGISGDTQLREIEGYWWQFVYEEPQNAVSFVHIRISAIDGHVSLNGDVYNPEGVHVARWSSIAAGFNAARLELFYFWRGDEFSEQDLAFSGIGLYSFTQSEDGGIGGPAGGWFTTGDVNNRRVVTGKRNVQMRRCEAEDVMTMLSEDYEAVRQLVFNRYASWAGRE